MSDGATRASASAGARKASADGCQHVFRRTAVVRYAQIRDFGKLVCICGNDVETQSPTAEARRAPATELHDTSGTADINVEERRRAMQD